MRKRGCATDPDTSCSIVSIRSTGAVRSIAETVARNSAAAAPASSDVRTTMVGSLSYVRRLLNRHIHLRLRLAVQPLVQHVAHYSDHGAPCRPCKMQPLPDGFSVPQYSRAIESLITTTHGDSAVSAGVNDRPRSKGIPIVSK